MALVTNNWAVDSYVVSTPTEIVGEPSVVRSLLVCNLGASTTIQVFLYESGIKIATIVAPFVIDMNESKIVDFGSMVVLENQQIMVQASTSGVSFLASGVDVVYNI